MLTFQNVYPLYVKTTHVCLMELSNMLKPRKLQLFCFAGFPSVDIAKFTEEQGWKYMCYNFIHI